MSSDEDVRLSDAKPAEKEGGNDAARDLPALRETIAAQIDATEARIRELKEDLSKLKRAHRSLAPRARPTPRSLLENVGNRRIGRWKHGSDAETLRNFVREALRKAGRPLRRKEIDALLRAADVPLDSKVPLKRLSKVMWESDEFQHGPEGYWFAKGFEPATDKDSFT